MKAGPDSNQVLDQQIDRLVRRVVAHDPPPQAYARVIDAVRAAARARPDVEAGSSWMVAVSGLAAAVLFAAVAVQVMGQFASRAAVVTDSGSVFLIRLSGSGFARWINESETIFGYPGMLFLHTLGLAMLVGVSVAVDLRLLGIAPRVPLASLRGLFPWMWLGFLINAASGVILFAADAPRKAAHPLFGAKLALVAIGVLVMTVIYRHLVQLGRDPARRHAVASRVLAVASLAIWMAAIAAGRLIAYAF